MFLEVEWYEVFPNLTDGEQPAGLPRSPFRNSYRMKALPLVFEIFYNFTESKQPEGLPRVPFWIFWRMNCFLWSLCFLQFSEGEQAEDLPHVPFWVFGIWKCFFVFPNFLEDEFVSLSSLIFWRLNLFLCFPQFSGDWIDFLCISQFSGGWIDFFCHPLF